MNEINDMKELMRLMLENKLTLLKNIFNETNFKVKIELGDQELETTEDKLECILR